MKMKFMTIVSQPPKKKTNPFSISPVIHPLTLPLPNIIIQTPLTLTLT